MVAMPQDKRQFPRTKIKVPLRYQVRGVPEFSNAVTDNISLGGVGFINDKFIAPLTNVMLEVNVLLNVLNPIARISWASPIPHSDKYRMGAEFVEIDQEQKKYLQDFIDMQELKL